ncbi:MULTISPECIES: L-2-amino-thiazoline-4-carboxylic acid hydrolase [Trichocoleus]|uniref:L-2-amino-thiazoline-4-carboxylic acid hydrolase n=1 Tax=Trichocoleus desertorum GB2-A4 TaxID=2933944 RepID=A0ABV0JEE5_9CYAN|nr:L-2-amino-thiazoline-4-carboxylic acid hydrolase [Trichocoleus sp. FACHB-46]MBD1864956.1 L-2-amino-thiazoline-4-carboxylic acid hydrolase [Trichocoleus sp. FACHB-46]
MENIVGIGDIQMADVMKMDSSKALNMFRNRFAAFKKLADEIGEDEAFEKMMEAYPAQQKAFMGAFIDNTALAKGFTDAIPIFRIMGFTMDVVDISQEGTDAVLEIQRVCPVLSLAKEYGLENPCRALCEMEQEATRKAFPGMKAAIISRQAAGDCVCMFKYERPAKNITATPQNSQNLISRIFDLIKLAPKIVQIGINLLKNRFSQG